MTSQGLLQLSTLIENHYKFYDNQFVIIYIDLMLDKKNNQRL